jgi:iron complex transport system substrate-binding protein
MRGIVFIIMPALFLVAAALTRCGPNANGVNHGPYPRRIISLETSATETLCMLGLADRIVGISQYALSLDAVNDRTVVGRGFGDINVETVVSLRPDLIVCWKGQDEALLKKRGFNLFLVESSGFDRVLDMIARLGEATGTKAEALALVADMERRKKAVTERVAGAPRPPVYFEDRKPLTSRAKGSLAHDLIELAGGRNILENSPAAYPRVNSEFVIASRPEIIILQDQATSPEEIINRPGWASIPAIKNRRIHVHERHHSNYSPRCIEGLESYARWIHPELF